MAGRNDGSASRRALAARFQQRRSGPRTSVVPVRSGAAAPLSWAQRRIWFIDQMGRNDADYRGWSDGSLNVHLVKFLEGPLDVEALRRALGLVVQRHEPLRAVLVEDREEPHQMASEEAPELQFRDLFAEQGSEPGESEIEALLSAEVARGFAPGEVLWRAHVLRCGLRQHIFVFTAHHLVLDGWSVGVLARELRESYAAERAGRPADLAPLRFGYFDYAAWQRGASDTETTSARAGDERFWTTTLATLPPPISLPGGRPRGVRPTRRGATVRFEVDAAAPRPPRGHSGHWAARVRNPAADRRRRCAAPPHPRTVE